MWWCWWIFSLYPFYVILEEFVDFKKYSILFSQQIMYKITLRQKCQGKIPQINIFFILCEFTSTSHMWLFLAFHPWTCFKFLKFWLDCTVLLQSGMSGCFTPTKGLQQKAKSLCALGEVQSQLEQKGNIFCDQQDWGQSSAFLEPESLVTPFKEKNQPGEVWRKVFTEAVNMTCLCRRNLTVLLYS